MRLVIDPWHTDIEFKIKHLMISTVNGRFNRFTGDIVMPDDGDLSKAQVAFVCEVASIDTGVKDRDEHLRSADFFDVEKHRLMSFQSTGAERIEGDRWSLTGDLTIKGVTKPITLVATYNGNDLDAEGQRKHGFDIEGEVMRKDYGLTFQAYGGAGGAMVGERVRLIISVQLIQDK
jgi:polyisoprenoid-binding protein YceI